MSIEVNDRVAVRDAGWGQNGHTEALGVVVEAVTAYRVRFEGGGEKIVTAGQILDDIPTWLR
jgi:hypothetical protein